MRRGVAVACLALAALLLGATTASAKRALIAFIPTQPAPKMPLLFDLEERDFAYGLTSPSIGAYPKRQMVLDMSAGARIANRASSRPIGRIYLVYRRRGGRMQGCFYDDNRVESAPGEVMPGLLAQTL